MLQWCMKCVSTYPAQGHFKELCIDCFKKVQNFFLEDLAEECWLQYWAGLTSFSSRLKNGEAGTTEQPRYTLNFFYNNKQITQEAWIVKANRQPAVQVNWKLKKGEKQRSLNQSDASDPEPPVWDQPLRGVDFRHRGVELLKSDSPSQANQHDATFSSEFSSALSTFTVIPQM